MVAEGTTEGSVEVMMANHSLHVCIVDELIIVLTVIGRSLANLIGLPILPLLMFVPLYPWLWWSEDKGSGLIEEDYDHLMKR